MDELKRIEVFFRVPAGRCNDGEAHGTYLSSTRIFARSRAEALAALAKRHPEYTELH